MRLLGLVHWNQEWGCILRPKNVTVAATFVCFFRFWCLNIFLLFWLKYTRYFPPTSCQRVVRASSARHRHYFIIINEMPPCSNVYNTTLTFIFFWILVGIYDFYWVIGYIIS